MQWLRATIRGCTMHGKLAPASRAARTASAGRAALFSFGKGILDDFLGLTSGRQECEAQVKGFPGSRHKKFRAREQAEAWLQTNGVQVAAGNTSHALASSSTQQRPSPARRSASPVRRNTSASPVRRKATPAAAARSPPPNGDVRVVYCDGACRGNGKVGSIAGVGVYWGAGDPRCAQNELSIPMARSCELSKLHKEYRRAVSGRADEQPCRAHRAQTALTWLDSFL